MKKYVQSVMAMGALVATIVIYGAAPALSFHPLITDDTGTQGKGNTELEFAYQYEEDRYRWFDRTPESVIEGTWGKVYTRDSANEG
nr:hypothetical protein [Spirochaetota bacterium]